MISRSDLITEVDQVIDALGLSGEVIEALGDLIKEAIYRNYMYSASLALEASGSRCILTNSAITHARDKMYSVYRGKNQRIVVTNVIPNFTFSVSKFDVCTSIGGIKLLFPETKVYIEDTKYDVELIVSKSDYKEVSIDITELDTSYANFIDSFDVSEDVALFVSYAGESEVRTIEEVPITDDFSECMREGSDKYMIMTGTDYSVTVIAPASITRLQANSTLTIRYVPYNNSELNLSEVKQLTNFRLTKDETATSRIRTYVFTKDNEHYFLDEDLKTPTIAPEDIGNYQNLGLTARVRVYYKIDRDNYVYRYHNESTDKWYRDPGCILAASTDELPYTDYFPGPYTGGVQSYMKTQLKTIVVEKGTEVYQSNPFSVRSYDVSEIFVDSNRAFLSQFLVRARDDLDIIIKKFFPYIVNMQIVIDSIYTEATFYNPERTYYRRVIAMNSKFYNYEPMDPDEVNSTNYVRYYIATGDNLVKVYYLVDKSENYITQAQVEAFNEEAKRAYYISEEFEFIMATSVVYDVKINIRYNSDLNIDDINAIIRDYCYSKIGCVFNIYQILANLQSVAGVVYSELVVDSLKSTDMINYKLPEGCWIDGSGIKYSAIEA